MAAPTTIKDAKGRKVLDSRGRPTVEVDVVTYRGFGRAAAPSGASKGKWEVKSYPDGGVDQAVKEVDETIAPKMVGQSADQQETIDTILHEIDGTKDFSRIGGNTAYAVSLATALAAASSIGVPLYQHLSEVLRFELPHPLGNVLGGGAHAKGRRTDIQEFLVLPTGARSFLEAAQANVAIHEDIASSLESEGICVSGKGDEGAWVSDLDTSTALEIVSTSCEKIFSELGVEVRVGLDMAASTLWNPSERVYSYQRDKRRLREDDQIDFVLSLIGKYRLVYVEDPLHEEAFAGFSELTKKAGGVMICGDDLFTTNLERFQKGLRHGAANAIIVKPNQIGTLTDASETARVAVSEGYTPVISHRSGDVPEPTLAHLAIAFSAPIIKTGVVGGERTAKINELIRIERDLGSKARLRNIRVK